jgi:hypothetical protein
MMKSIIFLLLSGYYRMFLIEFVRRIRYMDIYRGVKFLIMFVFLWLLILPIKGQVNLPLYEKSRVVVEKDWLLGSVEEKASLYRSEEGHLVFSNGLISRVFSVSPNGATIDFQDLTNGQSILRSVRPEALVVINGNEYEVGGLEGQPVHNYLKKSWIKEMTVNPGSFKFTGYNITDIQERFPWKKRLEWMPGDMAWPPAGKTLTMYYKADDEMIETLLGDRGSDMNRHILMEDNFIVLDPAWNIFTSWGEDRSLFINEGKAGEMLVPSNTSVYSERPLPEGTKVIKCKLNNGTDISQTHGLGMAVVFPQKTVRLAFSGTYGLTFYDGGKKSDSRRDSYTPYYFRIELGENELTASVSTDNDTWIEAGRVDTGGERPQSVRIGKTDPTGSAGTADDKGVRSRCQVEYFSVLGDFKDQSRSEAAAEYEFLKDIEVRVHYSLYDGLPLISKWISISNNSNKSFRLNSYTSELLAAVEPRNDPMEQGAWLLPNITVNTDFACGGDDEGKSYRWTKDPLYLTQIDYTRRNPCLLEVKPEYGPDVTVGSGETFDSYRVWELAHDNRDRERRGLALRKTWRTIAPWLTENPVLMHVRSAEDEAVKKAVDQCADVGFQLVIMTFGSGFNIEDDSGENLDRIKALADYAHGKGIALGGYSLLASRRISDEHDVVMPQGMSPRFGHSPCLCSEWGQIYFEKLYNFYKETGCDVLEHDGSYPGDVCASTVHPGHEGLADSRWKQFGVISDFYHWCRSNGIYLNVPDIYFLNGSSKTAMGYRETNWSLPRAEQEIIERQNVYDGTWEKIPSQGWMFVPLVQYHGGGAAATIEPLKDNLPHYNQRLANLFGAGVQACYRGPQLYDAPETREVVKKWVDFYKKHKAILNADIIHVRRPDGKDYDAILHVDPSLEEKGLLMIYNPLEEEISRRIKVNLYYTGLVKTAIIAEKEEEPVEYQLDREYNVEIPVSVPARSQIWFLIK